MHTPGPWRAEIRRTASMPWWHINTATLHGEITVNTSEEDASLIAAAPELLSACHALLAIVEQEYADDPEPGELRSWKRVIKQATEAIAKAEGRPCEQDRPVD